MLEEKLRGTIASVKKQKGGIQTDSIDESGAGSDTFAKENRNDVGIR